MRTSFSAPAQPTIKRLVDDQTARFDGSPERPKRVSGCSAGLPARRHVEEYMDTLVNQLARQLADAIAAAVADDARVEACREKARAAGLEMKVSLEAVIGFGSRTSTTNTKASAKKVSRSSPEMTANDRRFLKSLRIAA